MRHPPIVKKRGPVEPNVPDYAAARASFTWEVLDQLGAADRAGVVAIRGYRTTAGSGLTLSEHAIAHGYLGIMYGTATPPPATQRYELHGAPPEHPPEARGRSIVSLAAARCERAAVAGAAKIIARRDRMRSHAR